MWIVAGPNGSGKSTLAHPEFIQDEIGEDVVWLNADDVAKTLLEQGGLRPEEANLEAARQADDLVDAMIAESRSFLVETVLFTDKLYRRVEHARDLGFQVGLTFVVLATPELSLERVRQRVEMGGHDVPTEKIRARWGRSIANLALFAPLADVVHVIDNSEIGHPVLIAAKDNTGWHWHTPNRIREVEAVLRSIMDGEEA